MGLYDSIKLSVPPPGTPCDGWQTKDLDCRMAEYTIAADGVMTDSRNQLYKPPHSFVFYVNVEGAFLEMQAHVADGRVTKIRAI